MNVGFIGIGNMGGAILKGYAGIDWVDSKSIFVFDKDEQKIVEKQEELNVNRCNSIEELVLECDTIIIGVKPNVMENVLENISPVYTTDKTIISMAAGIGIKKIEEFLGESAKIIRIMPNTPVMVGEGMIAMFVNDSVGTDDIDAAYEMFSYLGKVEIANEDMIHCIIGVSGSSPAYTYMYIKALIKGAMDRGMDGKQAKVMASQAVLGAAKMILETDINPNQLIENVCSPGGTTIEAVKMLEGNGFEEKILEGFEACVKKSEEMSK